MIVGRVVGWVLLLAGLAVLVGDAFNWIDTGRFAPMAVGEVWFRLAPTSLQLAQPAVQRYLHPAIWEPGITSILLLWAAPFLIVLGGLFLLLFQRREGRRRRRR
jgi:hypothetical protein